MLVKAIKSFSGVVAMSVNEVRNITDNEILTDLLHAGYVILENSAADLDLNTDATTETEQDQGQPESETTEPIKPKKTGKQK